MRNNRAFRAIFTLPPLRASRATALTVATMPESKSVTGDREVDAMLWLQQVVNTGDAVLIEHTLRAAKKLKSSPEDLRRRYQDILHSQSQGSAIVVALQTMNFGNLEAQAKNATERLKKEHEALSRFGSVDALFDNTAAEAACVDALSGLDKEDGSLLVYDEKKVDARFARKAELVPATIADCLHGMKFWKTLYRLRAPFGCGDPAPEGSAHDDFLFRQLAFITPRSKVEALAALDCVESQDFDRTEAPAILRNLVGSGWCVRAELEAVAD